MAGRKKVKIVDLRKDWESTILVLASEGASEYEIRAELSMSDDLWYRLIDEEEEFSRTVSKARQLSRGWWDRQGRINLSNKGFNVKLWNLNMMNRFGTAASGEKQGCYKCFVEEQRKMYFG